MTEMNRDDVEKIIKDEIAGMASFDNWHGITADNLACFLVPPYEVMVDPDDVGETAPRPMWIVLQEYSQPEEGYLVAYDAYSGGWALIDHTHSGEYPFYKVIGGDSFAEVLNHM